MLYLWLKSMHLLFVIGWMAALFYLPRILVNIAELEDDDAPVVKVRLHLMGQRLYRFGHIMFGFALFSGMALSQGYRVFPHALPNLSTGMHWLDAKLMLVALMLAFFLWSGNKLKCSASGGALPSSKTLRVLNELPVLLLFGVIYLVLAKPF